MVRKPWSPAFGLEAGRQSRPARAAIASFSAILALALPLEIAHAGPGSTAQPAPSTPAASPSSQPGLVLTRSSEDPSTGGDKASSYIDHLHRLLSRFQSMPAPVPLVAEVALERDTDPESNRANAKEIEAPERATADRWDSLTRLWRSVRERLGFRDQPSA